MIGGLWSATAMIKIYKLLKILYKRLIVTPLLFLFVIIVLLAGGLMDLLEDEDE